MATEIPLTTVSPIGTVLSTTAGDLTGMYFTNGGKTVLYVRNNNTVGTTTITVQPDSSGGLGQRKCDYAVDHLNLVQYVVPINGARSLRGPFSPARFNDSNDRVNVTLAVAGGASAGNVVFGAILLP
jgi:hypothetical protein